MANGEFLNWDDCDFLWDDYNLGNEYIAYLANVYNVITDGDVIWDYALNAFTIIVQVQTSTDTSGGTDDKAKEKSKKKIKLIFIMGDDNNELIKIKPDKNISMLMIKDIENILTEKFNITVRIKNVQTV